MIYEQANPKRLALFIVTVAVFVAVVRNVAISALPFASLSPSLPAGRFGECALAIGDGSRELTRCQIALPNAL